MSEIQQTYETGAVRNNAAKLRYDLVPIQAYRNVAEGLTHGAPKYGERNWEKGLPTLSIYASTMRHLLAWFDGEDIDELSGISHIALAQTNLAMLAWTLENKSSMDNRVTKDTPKEGIKFKPWANTTEIKLLNKSNDIIH